MKIVMVWKNDYPWDIRVEKMCNALINDGHEVHLVCSNTQRQQTRERHNGMEIHRLPAFTSKVLNSVCSLPVFFNPCWIFKLRKVVREEKIEIIIVRDLPLMLVGIFIAKLKGLPVIFDMAENYAALWKDHVSRKGRKFYNHILKNPGFARILENYAINKVNHIIVVVEESKRRILEKGIPENKLTIVSNTPDSRIFEVQKKSEDTVKRSGFRMLYVGYVTVGRGLDIVIKSIPVLKKTIEDIRFVIAGEGKHLGALKILARKLGIEEYIEFCGWIDFIEVPSYIQHSDICVVPHEITDHVSSTIPNKLFDYMANSKPVIVSNAAPLKRIVEETGCGVVFESGNVDSFVEKVFEIRKSGLQGQMGQNGYEAVRTKYNWDVDARKLGHVIDMFNFNYSGSDRMKIQQGQS